MLFGIGLATKIYLGIEAKNLPRAGRRANPRQPAHRVLDGRIVVSVGDIRRSRGIGLRLDAVQLIVSHRNLSPAVRFTQQVPIAVVRTVVYRATFGIYRAGQAFQSKRAAKPS